MFKRFAAWLKGLFTRPDKSKSIKKEQTPADLYIPPKTPKKKTKYLRSDYLELWESMLPERTVPWELNKIKKGTVAYKEVERRTGIPWKVIGVVHMMEASGNFTKQLLNGQPWTQKTTWVPVGKGPWKSWEDAAVESFTVDVPSGDWSIEGTLDFLERYNGPGYFRRDKLSPYLWNWTNHGHGTGLFWKDHTYDPNRVSKQAGAALLLKELGYKGR